MTIYRYSLVQDGLIVARVESADQEQAKREISHYHMVYSQDGPCKIKELKPVEDKVKR